MEGKWRWEADVAYLHLYFLVLCRFSALSETADANVHICQHCYVEGDWSWSWWKGLKGLGHHSKITRMSSLALFVSVSVFYILSTQPLEGFLAQEEGWLALRFSTYKWKVQLRIVVMQNYVGIPQKSEITLVHVLVVSCFSLFFGTVLQTTHRGLLEAFTAVTETMSCLWYSWDWWNH